MASEAQEAAHSGEDQGQARQRPVARHALHCAQSCSGSPAPCCTATKTANGKSGPRIHSAKSLDGRRESAPSHARWKNCLEAGRLSSAGETQSSLHWKGAAHPQRRALKTSPLTWAGAEERHRVRAKADVAPGEVCAPLGRAKLETTRQPARKQNWAPASAWHTLVAPAQKYPDSCGRARECCMTDQGLSKCTCPSPVLHSPPTFSPTAPYTRPPRAHSRRRSCSCAPACPPSAARTGLAALEGTPLGPKCPWEYCTSHRDTGWGWYPTKATVAASARHRTLAGTA